MSFSMAGRGARGPEINITPLIDVLLTLIIVFMVVVSMDKDQGETAQIPQPNQKQTANISPPRTVVIQLVWIKDNQPPTVKINQDDADIDFQYVADVIDVAHHAGVQRVGLLPMDREMTGE
jgi:biopolymer transport protein ExbD